MRVDWLPSECLEDDCCRQFERWSVFQSLRWVRAWSGCLPGADCGAYVVSQGGEASAIWPGARFPIYRGLARQWVSNPWGTYGGILGNVQQSRVLEEIRSRLGRDRVASAVVTLHPGADLNPYRVIGGARTRFEPLMSHILDLRVGAAALWKGYDGKCRNQIRKGMSHGLEVEVATEPEEFRLFFSTQRETIVGKGGQALPEGLVKRLREWPEACRLYVARKGVEFMAGVLTLRDAGEVFYWAGVATSEGRRLYATNVLLHRAIEDAVEEGFRTFNFGASEGLPGVAHFKQGFGAGERMYYQVRFTTNWDRVAQTVVRLRANVTQRLPRVSARSVMPACLLGDAALR